MCVMVSDGVIVVVVVDVVTVDDDADEEEEDDCRNCGARKIDMNPFKISLWPSIPNKAFRIKADRTCSVITPLFDSDPSTICRNPGIFCGGRKPARTLRANSYGSRLCRLISY